MAKTGKVVVAIAALAALGVGGVAVANRNDSPSLHSGTVGSGAINHPQPTLAQLCTPGYTKTIRPPEAYTTGLKRQQMAAQHLGGTTEDYEEDHIVPLEVGGAPRDPDNLFPEIWSEAHPKDKIENAYHDAMCAGRITI